jgi:hypothetical protein
MKRFLLLFLLAALAPVRADVAPPLAPRTDYTPLPPANQPFTWSALPVPSNWPASVKVFQGVATDESSAPIRAWYVDVDYSDEKWQARPFLSTAPAGKEAVSSQAAQAGALVAINGGYFDMSSRPARTFSLVMDEGRILVPNIAQVWRKPVHFPVVRAAFGVRDDRRFESGWVVCDGDQVKLAPRPLPNAPGQPVDAPENYLTRARPWHHVTCAIGGGPILIRRGQIDITYDQEVFFGSGFSRDTAYPRAAIGATRDNHLIFFVADGKQPDWSVGLTLPRLAGELQKLGCVQAMNLDGGGSVTLAVNGAVLNKPSDGQERAVTSIFALVPADQLAVAQR